MTEVSLCLAIAGSLTLLGFLFLLIDRPPCWHHWEKSECKEYPPAALDGLTVRNMCSDDIIKLKQSHTTYVQRCLKCGIERYHTESRPEI